MYSTPKYSNYLVTRDIGIAQNILGDLARVIARKRVNELDDVRLLVTGNQIAAMPFDFIRADTLARASDHKRRNNFAPFGIG